MTTPVPGRPLAVLDEKTRPAAPRFEPRTEAERLPGAQLQMIHDHFRRNMEVLDDLIARAEQGRLAPEDLAQATDDLPLMRNYRLFGNLCGQHCQIIEMHHSIEDQAIFPELAGKSGALRPVVARLEQEHRAVHDHLEALVAALDLFLVAATPENFQSVKTIYQALKTLLLSHFRYEEDSIGNALGVLGIGI